MSLDTLNEVLLARSFSFPALIVFIVGAVLSYARVRQGRGSQFTLFLIAFLVFLSALIFSVWTTYWQFSAIDRDIDFDEIGSVLLAFTWTQVILNTGAWILLLVGLFRSTDTMQRTDFQNIERDSEPQPLAADVSNPLYGVKGWLRLFVFVNLYVSPVIFVITYALAWVGTVTVLMGDYPGTFIVVFIETAVTGFLVWKWIHISLHLRDLRADAAVEAKMWLQLSLGWVLLDIPLSFMSGLPADALVPQLARRVIQGAISFAIWYSYFCVSRRVKATYPEPASSVS